MGFLDIFAGNNDKKKFIKKIEGTSSTVVGLPLFELYDMLKEQGYSLIGLE